MIIIILFVFVFMAEESSFVRKFLTLIYRFCVAINAIGYAVHESRSHDAVIHL